VVNLEPIPIGVFDHPPPAGLGASYKQIRRTYVTEFGRFLTNDAYRFARWSKILDL